jgi:hypothetical protein
MSTIIATKTVATPFHFKSYTQQDKGYEKLSELLNAGRITAEDIQHIQEEGKADKFKRKSITLQLEVPVVTVEGFTSAQNDHLQHLVNKAVKTAQDDVVAAGNPEARDLVKWQDVLEAPFAQRAAAVKVTVEMVKATVELVQATMGEMFNEKVVAAVAQLGERRFSPAACQPVNNMVLERLQGVVAQWYTQLAEDEANIAAEIEPVINLWAANLEKVLKPSEELGLDIFE